MRHWPILGGLDRREFILYYCVYIQLFQNLYCSVCPRYWHLILKLIGCARAQARTLQYESWIAILVHSVAMHHVLALHYSGPALPECMYGILSGKVHAPGSAFRIECNKHIV